MPDALAGFSVKRQQTIGEQIVTQTIRAIKIEGSGAGGHKHQPGFGIECHTGPGIRTADPRVGVFRPRLISELARLRNSVEDPAYFAGMYVKSADMPGSGGKIFGREGS